MAGTRVHPIRFTGAGLVCFSRVSLVSTASRSAKKRMRAPKGSASRPGAEPNARGASHADVAAVSDLDLSRDKLSESKSLRSRLPRPPPLYSNRDPVGSSSDDQARPYMRRRTPGLLVSLTRRYPPRGG